MVIVFSLCKVNLIVREIIGVITRDYPKKTVDARSFFDPKC